MWESRICNPINNITGNTIYISTHISIYIFTYISTNFPSAFILKRDFFCAEGRRITFLCKFAVPNGKGAMGDAAGGLPVMCGDGKANRDVEYSRN